MESVYVAFFSDGERAYPVVAADTEDGDAFERPEWDTLFVTRRVGR
jgi:hypothetical protein